MTLLRPFFGLCITKTTPRNKLPLQTGIHCYFPNLQTVTKELHRNKNFGHFCTLPGKQQQPKRIIFF